MYSYKCGQCSAQYFGETTRHLKTRIAEHRGLSARTSKPVARPLNSSIRDHALQTGHDILNKKFSIILNTDAANLKISESIFIHRLKPGLNNTESSIPLHILGR